MQRPVLLPEVLWTSFTPEVQVLLSALIGGLESQIVLLQARILELETRLKQDSSNSSKPPSSDPPTSKPAPTRAPSGKKPGAQPGHPKAERALRTPDEILEHKPCCCEKCNAALPNMLPEPLIRQVWELPPIQPIVTEHRFFRATCTCGHTTSAAKPEHLPAGGYGPRFEAMLIYLTGTLHLSKAQAEQLCEDLLGCPISTGQICAIEAEFTQAVEPVIEQFKQAVPQTNVNMDETGWKQSGKRCWLWVCVASMFTLFQIRASRSGKVVRELLGQGYTFVVTTDRHGAYNGVDRRQLCWSHLLRDFQAMIDRGTAGKAIGEALLRISQEIFEWWHRIRSDGKQDDPRRGELFRKYRPLLEETLQLGLVCGCAKTQRVCRLLLKHKDCLWLFVEVEGIEPTNNAAERALRPAVMWRKRSQGTRSETGSAYVCAILSIWTTCKQQNRNVWGYLIEVCSAKQQGKPIPLLLTTP
jgi:transposase